MIYAIDRRRSLLVNRLPKSYKVANAVLTSCSINFDRHLFLLPPNAPPTGGSRSSPTTPHKAQEQAHSSMEAAHGRLGSRSRGHRPRQQQAGRQRPPPPKHLRPTFTNPRPPGRMGGREPPRPQQAGPTGGPGPTAATTAAGSAAAAAATPQPPPPRPRAASCVATGSCATSFRGQACRAPRSRAGSRSPSGSRPAWLSCWPGGGSGSGKCLRAGSVCKRSSRSHWRVSHHRCQQQLHRLVPGSQPAAQSHHLSSPGRT